MKGILKFLKIVLKLLKPLIKLGFFDGLLGDLFSQLAEELSIDF